ncbi:MAG: nitrilase-related carbon-nitrogen hydrolase [Candidatus Nanopelagicales bacterium]
MSIHVVRTVDGPAPGEGRTRVAAAQYGVTTDVDANLATALRFVDAAGAEGAQVLVLPEFGNHVSWYADREHARRMAVTLDGPYVKALAEAAAANSLWLMANCVVAQEDGRTTGTNLLFSPQGELVATSDKQVLMGSERLHLDEAVTNGPVVETPIARFGMYSCMDGVINETPRGLAVRGAQVLLNSLNSFALDEASLHIPVRAPENRVWIVAANKVGPLVPPEMLEQVSAGVGVPKERLHGAGESQIVAPDGTVVAMAPLTGDALVVADIDVSLADDKRRPDGTDVMAARRPEIYAPLGAEPRGRQAPAGAEELVAVAVVPQADGEAAIDEAAQLVRAAVAAGAGLVVLPELYCFEDGVVPAGLAADELAHRAHVAVATLVDAVHGADALVVTSLPGELGDAVSHDAVLLGADGVLGRQPQLHRVERHAAWVGALGDRLVVHTTPFGRLALVVGDDSIYPETFRLAALADADVVALPFSALEPWETGTGLVERSGENRLVLVAASRPGAGGTSLVCDLPHDFTLWSPHWSAPFAGVISHPDVVRAEPDQASLTVTVHPAEAVNRMVSRGTDLVDGRPWALLGDTVLSS